MRLWIPFLLVLTMASCGGGSNAGGSDPAPVATGLVYTDPSGSGWRFLRNASSTHTHLVLDLIPAAGSGRGVALTLQADTTKVAWAKVSPGDSEYIKPGGVYALGTGTVALVGTVKGTDLVAGIFQKGRGNAASYGASSVLSVSLDLSTSGLAPGTEVSLSVKKTAHSPASGALVDLDSQVQVGRLQLQ